MYRSPCSGARDEQMKWASSIRLLCAVALLPLAPVAQAEVAIQWVTVGDPGNACDTQECFGAVSDEYRIGKFEVSNAEYAEFLNAVAATDTNLLYNTSMGLVSDPYYGGIMRTGSSGSYTYSTITGRENMPVHHVSFWDATRFANWLHNGQPTGPQDSTTTEDGAYTLLTPEPSNTSVTRNLGATVFVTSEDEWYKAAYYKGGGTSAGYWNYPAGSDTQMTCWDPGGLANSANCGYFHGDLTPVGSYTGSSSPSGTFDQGGNVMEWTEGFVNSQYRRTRGGDFWDGIRGDSSDTYWRYPQSHVLGLGFRVASLVPICGNGTAEQGEDCDDGNLLSGDCCSAGCEFESEGSVCADADTCTLASTCDAQGTCVAGGPSNSPICSVCNEPEPMAALASGWTVEGKGAQEHSWESCGSNCVEETVNSNEFSFLVGPGSYRSFFLEGTLRVEPVDSDRDHIGLVFGYSSPINAIGDPNNAYNLLLLKWTGVDGGAESGLYVSRVQSNSLVPDQSPNRKRAVNRMFPDGV